MPYPARLLLPGERVVLDLRPHWSFFLGPVAAGVPLAAAGAALFFTVDLTGDAETAALLAFGAATLMWALWLAVRLLRWATTHVVLTTDRLIGRSGVLARHGRDIPLERINDIASSQSLFDRLVGSGALRVESAGEWGRHAFRDIPRPDAVREEVYRQMDLSAGRAATAAVWVDSAATGLPSVPAQIAELGDLRDRGLLSDAEFEAKKADLLERM